MKFMSNRLEAHFKILIPFQMHSSFFTFFIGTYYQYGDELVVPIIENTPREEDLEVLIFFISPRHENSICFSHS